MEPIPGPRGYPILRNMLEFVGAEYQLQPLERLADQYGGIFQLGGANRLIVVSSAELADELVDERRFIKKPPAALRQREGVARGLFSSRSDEADWGQAHRILVPAMGPLKIEQMFDGMRDIANQLILKWARWAPDKRILATDDFTRLTLDTIALCSMDYRFNSFYQDTMHPFVDAMLYVLKENGDRTTRPAFINTLRYSANAKYEQALATMRRISQEIIEHRRQNASDKPDLLNAMLYGKDPKTGERMRDELVAAQGQGFLIAGHETTSGLLSFTFYHLIKNPDAYLKAQKEVDEVVGKGTLLPKHLKQLTYVQACLREALRLNPTAPAITKEIPPERKDETVLLGGKYRIEPTDSILLLLTKCQQDVYVYGPDAKEFKPERMLDEEFSKLPSGAWEAFGNGSRACIGRPFAWQEATMITAMILQNFNLQLDDPSYNLKIKQTLTIKPKDLYIRASLRLGIEATALDHRLHEYSQNIKAAMDQHASVGTDITAKPMAIFYGSNTGTCQAFAQRLAADASAHSFGARVQELDGAVESLPRNTPVILITSSYEGEPPDNAARFTSWLEKSDTTSMEGVNYTVFGCGHKDWAKTFHRIPTLIDQQMARSAGTRLAAMGLTDASKGNMFGDFEDWLDADLWPALSSSQDTVPAHSTTDITISTNARASSLRYDVSLATVMDNQCLTAADAPGKWHMDIQLPSDTMYECGDYLAVLPLNPDKNVQRVMAHFKLPWDAVMTLETDGPSTIPSKVPLSVYDVLRSYVELSQPATKKNLKVCAKFTDLEEDKVYLESLATDNTRFDTEVLDKRRSVFDVLQQLLSIALPFAEFLSLLPPLRVRQYSISSSPLRDPTLCSITYGVISDVPSHADPELGFEGVAGTYLSHLRAGDSVQVSVKQTAKKTFRLPVYPEKTPMLMFAAGTGLAPFRGFLSERAKLLEARPDRKLAKATLFLGCRSQHGDRLYADEMDKWIETGVVDVRYAFSRDSEKSEGCKYVSDRMLHDKDDIRELWKGGARVYVCGSREFSKSVGQAARKIVIEQKALQYGGDLDGTVEREVEEWFASVASERIATDVFD